MIRLNIGYLTERETKIFRYTDKVARISGFILAGAGTLSGLVGKLVLDNYPAKAELAHEILNKSIDAIFLGLIPLYLAGSLNFTPIKRQDRFYESLEKKV